MPARRRNWPRAVFAHARRYFPDFVPKPLAATPLDFSDDTESVAEYFAYVLLDFAMADHEIEELALAHAARLASALGVKTRVPQDCEEGAQTVGRGDRGARDRARCGGDVVTAVTKFLDELGSERLIRIETPLSDET